MNPKTREGAGSYDHRLPDGQLLFGRWHLRVIDRDAITVTNTYAEEVTGIERSIPYVWRRKP